MGSVRGTFLGKRRTMTNLPVDRLDRNRVDLRDSVACEQVIPGMTRASMLTLTRTSPFSAVQVGASLTSSWALASGIQAAAFWDMFPGLFVVV